jgi:hypothetical protein
MWLTHLPRSPSVWLILLAFVLCSGCSHHFGPAALQDIGRYTTLQPGLSTKADVYQRFGQPSDVLTNTEGTRWSYIQVDMSIHGATFVPFVGLIAGGSNMAVTSAMFYFDATGQYQRVETSKESHYQNMWAGMAGVLTAGNTAEARVRTEMHAEGRLFDEAAWKEGKAARELR